MIKYHNNYQSLPYIFSVIANIHFGSKIGHLLQGFSKKCYIRITVGNLIIDYSRRGFRV